MKWWTDTFSKYSERWYHICITRKRLHLILFPFARILYRIVYYLGLLSKSLQKLIFLLWWPVSKTNTYMPNTFPYFDQVSYLNSSLNLDTCFLAFRSSFNAYYLECCNSIKWKWSWDHRIVGCFYWKQSKAVTKNW